jgi:hypothetical protein
MDEDAPLRLATAAELAFPDGSMTASGLRREGRAGRLVIERIAGKDYTTLAEIKRMRAQCHVKAKARAFGYESEPAAPRSGSSATVSTSKALAALRVNLDALKKPSKPTSPKSTSRARRAANVIRLQSRSPTC